MQPTEQAVGGSLQSTEPPAGRKKSAQRHARRAIAEGCVPFVAQVAAG